MDFCEELLLSALISILLAYLLSTLLSSKPNSSSPSMTTSSSSPPPTSNLASSVTPSGESDVIATPTPSPDPNNPNSKIEGVVAEIERVGGEEEEEEGWEKCERSDEQVVGRFGEAARFAKSDAGKKATKAAMSGDMQLRMYGLHKVATEGTCFEPQPMMPLLVSARAKWNAWQRLGNMNPEAAMEQYVTLLSECIPGWNEQLKDEVKDIGGSDTLSNSASESNSPAFSPSLHDHQGSTAERLVEDSSLNTVNVEAAEEKQSNRGTGLTKTFLFNLLSPARVTFLTVYH